jgi:regulatory protein
MRRQPVDRDPPDPYTYGLQALGRRELTARQLRDRLRRRGCDDAAIDAALERLRREGALDDARAARAYARTEVAVKRRGPERIRRALHVMGVDEDAARSALASGFADHPAEDVLDAALARRLRGRPVTDRAQEQRLIAYLVRQGFDVAAAAAAVRRHRQA